MCACLSKVFSFFSSGICWGSWRHNFRPFSHMPAYVSICFIIHSSIIHFSARNADLQVCLFQDKDCTPLHWGELIFRRRWGSHHLRDIFLRDISSARHFNCATSHLRDFSDARHFNCAISHLRDIPFARQSSCTTFQLRDIPSARLPICATFQLRDIPSARHPICATFQLRDIPSARQPICATFFFTFWKLRWPSLIWPNLTKPNLT